MATPPGAILPAVTSAAKVRYLRLLGFQPGPEPDESATGQNTETAVSAPAEPAGRASDADVTIEVVQNRKESAKKSHVLWRHADGEWVRGGWGQSSSPSRPKTPNSLTMAGSVAIETENDLGAVWARFKKTEAQQDRDDLIVYYAPLVKYVASRIAAGLPQTVDQSDLISYGMFGLIDAITKFDPERGFKFETYAVSRIKGAILDELRSIDWVPRSVRSKAKAVERAMAKLESKLHRPPTDSEIADELDLTSDQLSGVYKQIGSLGMVALDEMLSAGGTESLTFGDTVGRSS